MKSINPRARMLSALALAVLAGAFFGGCSGDDGKAGDTGPAGTAGTAGAPGVNCWDLNQNSVADLATEDVNKDGKVDVNDCRTSASTDPAAFHKTYFTDNAYTSTAQCLNCHGREHRRSGRPARQGARQEGPDQQLLPGGPVQRGSLFAVPHRRRLGGQELRLQQPTQHRLPGLPRPDRNLQESPDAECRREGAGRRT